MSTAATLDSVTSRGFFTKSLAEADPEIAGWIAKELGRQRDKIELIASENITSRADVSGISITVTTKASNPSVTVKLCSGRLSSIAKSAGDMLSV
mgnify:CR=1 FL=1